MRYLNFEQISENRAMFKNDNYHLAGQKQAKKQRELKLQQEMEKQKKQDEFLKNFPNSKHAKKIKATKSKEEYKKIKAQAEDEEIFAINQHNNTGIFNFSISQSTNDHSRKEEFVDDLKILKEKIKTSKKSTKTQIKIEDNLNKIEEEIPEPLQIEKKEILQPTDSKTNKDNTNIKSDDEDDFDELLKVLKAKLVAKQTQPQKPEQQIRKPEKFIRTIFRPKCTLKIEDPTQNLKLEKKESFKSMDQIERERRMQEKKMKAQLKKLEGGQDEKKNDKKKQNSEINDKKSTKIKKSQMNYNRLDMKRKYKDKFVGGMRQNQRKYTKNGVLKPRYRMQSELQMQNGEVQNTYIHSLSSSFFVKLNIDSDEEGENEEQKVIEIPSVEECSEQRLTQIIEEMFGFEKFRQGQYEVIKNIINHKSTIFVSETASGKSLTYIISSIIMAKQFHGMSIVISPLIALMLDQLDHLPQELPAACISSLIDYEQRKHILQLIKDNKVKLLFITPEMLMTDILFHVKQFPPINFICVDEAHCLSELSHNFRTSYIALTEIIKSHIRYNTPNSSPNILCLTATANTETIESLQKKLKVGKIIKSSSTLNKNLYITITREVSNENKYRALVQYLNMKEIRKCEAVLIYCRSKYLLDKVFNFLSNSGLPATVFHGALQHKEKTRIITEFKQKKIRIIISTTALGMGLDFEHLDCIVHFNMAKSLESFVQEIGRAGRRQNRAYCHLFLDESDFFIERNYILADELEEHSMKAIADQLEKSQSASKVKKIQLQKTNKKEKMKEKEEEMARVVNRACLAIEKMEERNDNSEDFEHLVDNSQEDEQKYEKENSNKSSVEESSGFAPLYLMNVKQLSEKTTLREQALLIILMKTAQTLNRQLTNSCDIEILRILPLSHEFLKLSFFKSNQKELANSQQYGQFYRSLVDMNDPTSLKANCKKIGGNYHIPLIQKSNHMKMTPIELMSKVYEISNHYVMKVEFVNEVYVFSIDESKGIQKKKINQKLRNLQFHKTVINTVNQVQNMSMTKLQVFYSLAFNFSQVRVEQLTKKNLLISRQTPIPSNNIMNEITKYFNTDIISFYTYLTQTKDELQREMYLPTEMIEPHEMNGIYENVKLFYKNMFSTLRDNNNKEEVMRRKEGIFEQYEDGKIITRVFLGVNEEKSSRMIFGEHSYWRKFMKKKYFCLLKTIRDLINKGKEDILAA